MGLVTGQSNASATVWESALETLERNFSKPVYEMWIKPMRFIAFRDNELHLAVHSKFAREWVGTKLQHQIVDVLKGVFGPELELRLSVADSSEPAAASHPAPPPPGLPVRPIEDLRTANLNVRYTFESSSSERPTGSRMRRRRP